MTRSSDKTDSRCIRRLRRRPLGRYRYVRLRWRVTFAVIDLLGTAVFAAARAVRRVIAARTTAPSKEERDPKVILLVQLDHLGDAIISTAMLPVLREQYPHAAIEVLAGAWNREVFEALPEVSRVHVSRVNRFARGGLARFAWVPATFWWGLALRRRRVDLGVDVRGEFPVALILWLCGARRRLGWDCGGGGFLLTDCPEFVADRPEVESRTALLAALGISPAKAVRLRPSFRPDGAARRRIARRLAEFAAAEPAAGPRVVLHVGAGTPAKTWPVEHWRELLGRIIVGHGARVILVGSRQDRNVADEILGGPPIRWGMSHVPPMGWPGVADWTGRLSIVELAALLERADVLVGADSGPAHLAAAVGTPVVALFSGTNGPRQWQPCSEQVTVVRHPVDCSPCHRERCPRAGHPCMRLLRPRQVAAAVDQVLYDHIGHPRRRPRRRKGAPQ